ncbi:helix-turn-helix domain-containing protein [Burkholderia pseudomultivorans]|uniref:helix-turn-helix domain-containing protein n=1 Tax=Burkholderia pseudomultivorans TaxID=1207504 RepID=UPI0028761B49|nr:helix-turn-helix transcriptional regulator [Burkholderia pseudomultivorans]MDS0856754.1 helix-turn-helix domain-containing protein [Burkholderia pseudomultivorans]
MDSAALVTLVLKKLACTQAELALRVGVSPTQITKWKKGEHMSLDMEGKFRALANIGDKDPTFVAWAGSLEAAKKWDDLIRYLAEVAEANAETGYNTEPLDDDSGLLSWQVFNTLNEMGVALPKVFPQALDIDFDDVPDNFYELIDADPIASLIDKILSSFVNVYGFYAAYISHLLFDDELDIWDEVGENIDSRLMSLAATKIKIDDNAYFSAKFRRFSYDLRNDYEEWLNIVREKAYRAGIPLRAELLSLVYGDEDELREEAEKESLGFNASRLHPDIYMNELLQGMRVIHQVLPVIMKKLGIDDFDLDKSELRLK